MALGLIGDNMADKANIPLRTEEVSQAMKNYTAELAKRSKEGRAEVRKRVNADKEAYGHEVLQYSMDNIGIPDTAKTVLDS